MASVRSGVVKILCTVAPWHLAHRGNDMPLPSKLPSLSRSFRRQSLLLAFHCESVKLCRDI